MLPELPRHIIQKIFHIVKIHTCVSKIQNTWRIIKMRRTIIYNEVISILENINFSFKYYYNKNIDIYCIKAIYRVSCKSIRNNYQLKNNFFLYYTNLLNMHILSRDIYKIRTYEQTYYKLYKELPSISYDSLL